MNKKGFTLVELLAVIVILAVILAIAVPGISGIVNSSKKSAFEADVKMLVKGIEYKELESTVVEGESAPAEGDIADITIYGGIAADYSEACITDLDPVTICITSAPTSKFGEFNATATRNTVTINTSTPCTCP